MAFCTTCCSPTCRTNSGLLLTHKRCATGTLCSFPVHQRPISSIKFVIQLVSWCFHCVEYVEAPVYNMVIVCMCVRADVAHSHFTGGAVFKRLDIWKLILIMQLTGGKVCSCWCDMNMIIVLVRMGRMAFICLCPCNSRLLRYCICCLRCPENLILSL